MMATVFLFALAQQPVSPPDTTAGRPCKVVIDSIGRQAQQVEVRAGETNVFAGGGVLAHCDGTGTALSADTVAWFAGVKRFDMIGQRNPVHIRDTTLTLDATTAAYFLSQERLEAHRNVVAVNRTTKSVLRGPNLIYYRPVPGIRDTLEMYSTGRPTIDYHATADSGEPYVIVADRVRLKGNDRMWGGGRVTIDRSDFAAQGDSMQLDQPAGFGVLVGTPAVEGKGARAYKLTGTRIELGLAGREVKRVKALGNGVATGADWRLTADTIDLYLDRSKLQRAFAWGPKDSVKARAVSATNTIRSDSLALDLPDEVLTETRAFGHALSTMKKDSTAKAQTDWIAGDSLTARWAQLPDSAGTLKSKLHLVISRSNARALTHTQSEHDTAGPSINYSRGQLIRVVMKGDKIDTVKVTGHADGLQLDHKPPAPPDTSKHATPPPTPHP